MKTNNILLALICASVFSAVPVSVAAESSKKEVEKVDSAFKTFKKDIRCMLSRRQKCTAEQKRRLIRDGLGLAAAVVAITGFALGAKFVAIPAFATAKLKKVMTTMENYAQDKGLIFKQATDLQTVEDVGPRDIWVVPLGKSGNADIYTKDEAVYTDLRNSFRGSAVYTIHLPDGTDVYRFTTSIAF